MPRFLDHHPVAHSATADVALQALQNQIRAAEPDDFGVKEDAYVVVMARDIASLRARTRMQL